MVNRGGRNRACHRRPIISYPQELSHPSSRPLAAIIVVKMASDWIDNGTAGASFPERRVILVESSMNDRQYVRLCPLGNTHPVRRSR